ncbi:MAG TPA: hypothetical protein VKT51_09905 [Candidatus Eremiobacteraceae bacterium]|nr:hypothetical protein [Candidatus Eremiobacteraceae bacterium]
MDAPLLQFLLAYGIFGLFGVAGIVVLCYAPNGAPRWTLLIALILTAGVSVWNLAQSQADAGACATIAMFVSPKAHEHDAASHVCVSAWHLHGLLQVAMTAVLAVACIGGLASRSASRSA